MCAHLLQLSKEKPRRGRSGHSDMARQDWLYYVFVGKRLFRRRLNRTQMNCRIVASHRNSSAVRQACFVFTIVCGVRKERGIQMEKLPYPPDTEVHVSHCFLPKATTVSTPLHTADLRCAVVSGRWSMRHRLRERRDFAGIDDTWPARTGVEQSRRTQPRKPHLSSHGSSHRFSKENWEDFGKLSGKCYWATRSESLNASSSSSS